MWLFDIVWVNNIAYLEDHCILQVVNASSWWCTCYFSLARYECTEGFGICWQPWRKTSLVKSTQRSLEFSISIKTIIESETTSLIRNMFLLDVVLLCCPPLQLPRKGGVGVSQQGAGISGLIHPPSMWSIMKYINQWLAGWWIFVVYYICTFRGSSIPSHGRILSRRFWRFAGTT